jgi:hypothetical protein
MLKFETDVRLNANASSAAISTRLNNLVATPFSFGKRRRRKPLRGRISPQGGFLRWPLNEYRIGSPRNLKFKLLDLEGGAVLVGKFALWQPHRVVVLIWLTWGLTVWTWTLIKDLLHHAGLHVIGRDLLFPLLGCSMAFGYLAVIVFFGRKRNRDLIRVLRTVLASEAGAEIVTDLFSRNSRKHESFMDQQRS